MIKFALFPILFFCIGIGFTFAAADDFGVRLQVGDDALPPTTPTSLTATPVAQTQIDLSWGASTDDFILEGYQVFRDAIQIATTTLTSYSDSGLTASTTYTYFVKAYDSFFNISSSSNSAATTTFRVTPTSTPTTTSSSNGGGQSKLELVSFVLTPAQHTANVQWKTNHYAQFEFKWGRSSSYELGFVTSNLYVKENTTLITDLQPGTTYEFQLVGQDKQGRTVVLKEGQFVTEDSPDTQAPANVSNLRAVVDGDAVRLSWDNPKDPDFSFVRIVRNYLFYPTDPYDGYLIYQNNGNQVVDRDALEQKKVQYYTVFSYDKNGNISSGAIVAAWAIQETPEVVVVASTTLPLRISDIEILQDNVIIDSQAVTADLPVTFRIAYEKLPEHLKTITVALTHPENAETEFSFLLKINKDKTYYEATVSPLEVIGLYPMTVSVFDYQLKQLYTAQKPILVSQLNKEENVFGIPLSTKQKGLLPELIVFLWLLLLCFLLYLLYMISRNISFERKIHTVFGKTRFAMSILLCLGFGGISAYLLAELGVLKQQGDATIATAFQSITPTSNTGFIFATIAVASLVFVIFGVIMYFLKKKSQ